MGFEKFYDWYKIIHKEIRRIAGINDNYTVSYGIMPIGINTGYEIICDRERFKNLTITDGQLSVGMEDDGIVYEKIDNFSYTIEMYKYNPDKKNHIMMYVRCTSNPDMTKLIPAINEAAGRFDF